MEFEELRPIIKEIGANNSKIKERNMDRTPTFSAHIRNIRLENMVLHPQIKGAEKHTGTKNTLAINDQNQG